jgi:hypothetical protein
MYCDSSKQLAARLNSGRAVDGRGASSFRSRFAAGRVSGLIQIKTPNPIACN